MTAVIADFASDVYEEVRLERVRANLKHGATSMEQAHPLAERRLRILVEEVGEVAQEYNDAENEGREIDRAHLREELIQCAAMAVAWADALSE